MSFPAPCLLHTVFHRIHHFLRALQPGLQPEAAWRTVLHHLAVGQEWLWDVENGLRLR